MKRTDPSNVNHLSFQFSLHHNKLCILIMLNFIIILTIFYLIDSGGFFTK